ncbi:MAG: thermonuclease family protein, partial [Nitriliruptoraceae bacterium]
KIMIFHPGLLPVRVIADPRGSIPGGGSIRVRLLNIDAPELARDDRPAECGARDAVAHMLELVAPGDVVWLVADEDDRDDFDRPLRGMWTDDGVFVNEAMAAAGWARDVVFAPNDRFFDVVAQAAATARADGRGMWEKCAG